MEKIYYFDNASATRLDEHVFNAMTPYFMEKYSVATSEFGYSPGVEAREAMEDARKKIADALGAKASEFIFTSGSTESSNLAIKGVAKALGAKKGKHLIVSKVEDFPVLYSARTLQKEGFSVDYLEVDEQGQIDLGMLDKLIRPETILVSIQHGNQEIGTLQDIDQIAAICQKKEVLFHTDATHTFMRTALNVQKIKADLITVSAHTLHGPKGIGGLYVREGTPLSKIMDGGFQEFDLRGGMDNIPGAVGFAKAISRVTEAENISLKKLRDHYISRVMNEIPDVTLNGHGTARTPQNANVTFHYVEGESITLHLDMYGIAVSTGSACFSRSLEASHVIAAIGGDHERAHGSIQVTLGRYNTIEEIDFLVETLAKVVGNLRKISPLGKDKEV
ncbi:MAG: cysteine desulfurase [Eubacteriaceae bacterium]|nr:cysteine desulfurase [Acetobacterium sp.]MDN5308422.1 cysteine desulfurase [Eubacteriaceae bacterium]